MQNEWPKEWKNPEIERPKEGTKYLVISNNGAIENFHIAQYNYLNKSWTSTNNPSDLFQSNSVTHYCSLPPEPKLKK